MLRRMLWMAWTFSQWKKPRKKPRISSAAGKGDWAVPGSKTSEEVFHAGCEPLILSPSSYSIATRKKNGRP